MVTESTELEGIASPEMNKKSANAKSEIKAWIEAFKHIFPIYLSTHLAFAVLTYLAILFRLDSHTSGYFQPITLLTSWNNWDSQWYSMIAHSGYSSPVSMAFFPLFPGLESVLSLITHLDPFYAGLLISNLAGLGMLMILYRIVCADFDHERAVRTVLYLAVFPTAFFFAAAYTESLFMFFSLLTFFLWRRGQWWLAGLAAVFSGLTRSTSICLLIPFVYEYLYQHDFQWRKIRFNVLSGIGTVGGVILFGAYGYVKFHDALAFSHAQEGYGFRRYFSVPWTGFEQAIGNIAHLPFLSFVSIYNMIDLTVGLFMLGVLILAFVGPVRFRKEHLSYALYGAALYLSINTVPNPQPYPNIGLSRYILEIFPAFIILASLSRWRNFNLYYLGLCLPLLAFMVLQWVTIGFVI